MEDRLARVEEMLGRLLTREEGGVPRQPPRGPILRDHGEERGGVPRGFRRGFEDRDVLRQPRRGYHPHAYDEYYDEHEDRLEPRRNYEDRGLKLEIPDFDGTTGDPETYLEWEKSMERYFEYKDTPEDRKFKLAKMKLVRSAGIWFEGLQKQRLREERSRVMTWEKLKKNMRRKYVPSNYKQTLYIKMSSLKQDKLSVQDYIREFEKLIIDCDINETEELKMGRFVGGLNEYLRERLEAYPNLSYDEATSLASVFERQRKGKGVSTSYEAPLKKDAPKTPWRRQPTPFPYKPTQGGSSNTSQASPFTKGREVDKTTQKRDTNVRDVVCYKCHGFGHYQKDCPNKRAFTIREWRDVKTAPSKHLMLVETEKGTEELYAEGEEGDYVPWVEDEPQVDSDDMNVVSGEEGEYDERVLPETTTLVVRKSFLSTPAPIQHEQRENLFQTKCRVRDEVCDVIIDSGSQTNCVDKRLVDRLGLKTTVHPTPYKLRWLDESSGQKVRKQCLVNLKIGSYKDDILCDVLHMDACHILLGRPWQHDKRAKHDGYTNIYSFKDKGKRKALLPLPPTRCTNAAQEKKATVSFATGHEVETEIKQGAEGYLLIMKHMEESVKGKDPRLVRLLEEFEDVFPEDLPPGLPPIRGIEHQIDLIPGAPLPNKAAYRCNPEQTKELQRQIEELMKRGYVRESLSPCAVPALLVPKKDGT